MKIAIVLKLEKKVQQKIQNLKNIFKKKHKKYLYADDFPHLTLLTLNTNLRDHQLKKVNFRISISNIKIKILKPHVFKNDLLTGGNTFFYKVYKNKKLLELQLYMANKFKKYIKNTKINIFNKKTLEYKSFKKYGFPFIGNHWIPHVSICSVLDKKINNIAKTKFISSKFNSHFYVNKLFLCSVKKNSLLKIKEIKFNV